MKKINIIWLVNDFYINTFEYVYSECKKSEIFNITIVACPHVGHEDLKTISSTEISKFLTENDIENIDCYNNKTGKILDLKTLNPDYVFYLKPYNYYLPDEYNSKYIKTYSKICSIPYGSIMINYDKNYEIMCKNEFYDDVYKVFNESNLIDGLNYQNKIKTIGYLKLDKYFYYNKKSIDLRIKNDNFTVIWKPRWTLESYESHFFEYIEEFIKIVKEYPDIIFKIYFHPLFEYKIDNKNLRENFNNYISKLSFYPNFKRLEGQNFLDEVLNADIFISDHSSTLVEFALTGKPYIFCKSDITPNKLGKIIIDNSYIADNRVSFRKNIINLINGKDYKENKRKKNLSDIVYFPKNGISCSQYLLENLIEDYIENLQNEKLSLNKKLISKSNKYIWLKDKVNVQNKTINEFMRDKVTMANEKTNLIEEIQKYKKVIFNMENSKSWKLTKIFRLISERIKKWYKKK